MSSGLQVRTISKFLSAGLQETRGALDLSFTDDAVAEEKIPFLAHLARALEDLSYFPHESPAGSSRFRNLIAGFMRIYHHIPLTPAVSESSPLLGTIVASPFHPNCA